MMIVTVKELKRRDLDKDFSKLKPDITIEANPGDRSFKISPNTHKAIEMFEEFKEVFRWPTIPPPDEDPWKWLHYFGGRIGGNMRYFVTIQKSEEDRKAEVLWYRFLSHPTSDDKQQIVKWINAEYERTGSKRRFIVKDIEDDQ